jgi:glucose-6-phosphate 1-dehydrogenase
MKGPSIFWMLLVPILTIRWGWFLFVRVEIRIQFHHVPGNLYRDLFGYNLEATTNELILRDQPEEGIFLKINNKVPGLGTVLDTTELNLQFRDMYVSLFRNFLYPVFLQT